jgi:ABC-2 type transport system ATP-binding protein
MERIAIEAVHARKLFDRVVAVDDVSFAVPAGSVWGLLGGNGAGKTTTIAMLLGLVRPTAGQARVLGEDMGSHRDRVLARMNFSSPYLDLPNRLTVRQNLTVYARLYGIDAVAGRIRELASQLDFVELMDREFGKLSAGQKTRVALAKALVNQPEVLFLDEPTASLDPDSADWVRAWIEDYRKQTGATILLASHNMSEVERLCDHVLIMQKGRIVDSGAPGALIDRYGRDTLEEVFLDIARGRGKAGERERVG